MVKMTARKKFVVYKEPRFYSEVGTWYIDVKISGKIYYFAKKLNGNYWLSLYCGGQDMLVPGEDDLLIQKLEEALKKGK